MITLLTFPPSFGCPAHSPYCVKAMCLLEMAGEAWEPEYLHTPEGMPYNKLPVILQEGKLLPDSGKLQRFLEQRGADFYPGISAPQKAVARAFQRLAEDGLGIGLVYERWLNDDCWPHVRDTFFAGIPADKRTAATDPHRDRVRGGLMGLGYARMNDEDRLALMQENLDAVEAMLWQGAFLFGDRPTAADASVVPFLDMLSGLPGVSALGERVKGNERLMAYVAAGRAAMYPAARAAVAA